MPTNPSKAYIEPTLLTAWEKGGLSYLEISPLSREQAFSLRHKLYRARTAMRKQHHPSTAIADQGTISIGPRNNPDGKVVWALIIYPTSTSMSEALEKAGLNVNDPPPLD